jgi:hypothetical protein
MIFRQLLIVAAVFLRPSYRLFVAFDSFFNLFIEWFIGAERRDSSRTSGTGETINVARRRMGSPHTLRKASLETEINLF